MKFVDRQFPAGQKQDDLPAAGRQIRALRKKGKAQLNFTCLVNLIGTLVLLYCTNYVSKKFW